MTTKTITRKDLEGLAVEEKMLDDIAQCGLVSKHFPDLSDAIMEAKRELQNTLASNGIKLGSI